MKSTEFIFATAFSLWEDLERLKSKVNCNIDLIKPTEPTLILTYLPLIQPLVVVTRRLTQNK